MEPTKTQDAVASELDGHAYPDPRSVARAALVSLATSPYPAYGVGPHHDLLRSMGLVEFEMRSEAWGFHQIARITPFGRAVARCLIGAQDRPTVNHLPRVRAAQGV